MGAQDMGDVESGPGDRWPHPDARVGRFAAAHGLTPAETEVLAQILQGRAVKEIANARSASEHTVRAQVRAILHKTRTHSQRQLVARVSAS